MRALICNRDIKEVLQECFSTDKDLISTYHIESGSNLDICVDRTAQDLSLADESFKLFLIYQDNELAGFFGKEHDNYLTTIFVKPSYRSRSAMEKIWEIISSHFISDYYTAIYSKNTRAASFYSRNGVCIDTFNVGTDEALAFKFSKGA